MSEFNKLPFYSIQNSAAFKKKKKERSPLGNTKKAAIAQWL